MKSERFWIIVIICSTFYLANLRILYAYKTNRSTEDCFKKYSKGFHGSENWTKITCYFSWNVSSLACNQPNIVSYWHPENQNEKREIVCEARLPLTIQLVFGTEDVNNLTDATKIVYTKKTKDIKDKSTFYYATLYFPPKVSDAKLIKYYLVQQKDHEENQIILYPSVPRFQILATNDTVEVEDELVHLPCNVRYSEYPEGIYKGYHNGAEHDEPNNMTSKYIPVDNKILKWDYVRGFRLNVTAWNLKSTANNSFIGQYFCRTKRTSLALFSIKQYFNVILSPDFSATPNSGSVNLSTFSTAQLNLKCRSGSPLKVVHTFENASKILIRNRTFSSYETRYEVEIDVKTIKIGTDANIRCEKVSPSLGSNSSHNWHVVVKDLTRSSWGLQLDRKGHEAFCHQIVYTNFFYPSRFKNVACFSPHECNYLKECLRNDFQCEESSFVKCAQSCWRMRPPQPTGMIQCGDDNPVIYFRAFNNILYNHWEDVPEIDHLLELRVTDQIRKENGDIELYTNGTFEFVCKFHRFLSDGDAHWLIIFKNGTSKTLEPLEPNLINLFGGRLSKSEFNEVSKIIYIDSTEIAQVMCIVPSWDTEEWVNNSLSLHIREFRAPEITSKNKYATFYLGVKYQTMKCDVDSYPLASIRFHRRNMTQEDLISKGYKLDIEEPGSLSLIFPKFSKELEGEYFCTASNDFGESTESFIVTASSGQDAILIGVGSAIGIFIFILIAAFIRVNFNLRKAQGYIDKLSAEEIEDFLNGFENTTDETEVNPDAFPYDRSYDIEKDRLLIEKAIILGSGEFGVVYKGRLDETSVAVKTIKSAGSASHIRSLLSELKLLIYIGKHDSIVELIGAFVQEIQDGVLYLALELCELGNLHSVLKEMRECEIKLGNYCDTPSSSGAYHDVIISKSTQNNEPETQLLFLKWCFEIATAMEFLQQKHVIHSDLAARNILLTCDKRAKLTDFGLSRKLYKYTEYKKENAGPLPWRWMAIECLRDLTFFHESDVWSFGIVIWEIYSYGATPYPGVEYDAKFFEMLESGLRNRKPEDIPDESLYTEIIMKCWEANPKDRISFSTIKSFFEEKLMLNKQNSVN